MFNRSEIAAARRILASYGVRSLLSDPDANPRLEKSLGLRVYSAPLHLAPAKLSGYEVCPKATAGCRAACLHTAGNPIYMEGKTRARIARTRAYFEARGAFMVVLWAEIAAHVKRAKRLGFKPAVRLNATSDIPWERVPLTNGPATLPNIMAAFPDIQFYDYTKRANRIAVPRNYHLTFSLAEGNDADAITALNNGHNVAVVFNVKRGKPLPNTFWLGGIGEPRALLAEVIDGDTHDFRPADPRGVIVGLRAKGTAINDTSGFVRPA